MNEVDRTPGERPLLRQWLNGICIAHIAHKRAAVRYRRRHILLGVPATLLSILVGTSVFGSLAKSENATLLLVAGFSSILAAILGGLQTFLNYGTLSASHQAIGVKYGSLRRRVETLIATEGDVNPAKEALESIRSEWDALDAEAPPVPQGIHDGAVAHVRPRAQLPAKATRELAA